ncbi:MAG: UbiA family prenyltransferase [archaeon]|nr:UbiA family prenyltransferase [archaeon]MCP8305893.1 UbiA family prenyltransferase [archaeon]
MKAVDLRGTIDLIRPINSIMVGFAVMVGISVASPSSVLSMPSLLGFLTGFFISSFSMVMNDYYDVEVDKVNRPDRPLPSGRVSPNSAIILASVLLIFGIASSILISFNNFIIASAFTFLAWLYNFWGKSKGLVGNLMVAASVAIPFIYGGMAVGCADNLLLLWLALTSFLAATGREVVKTICDMEGDKFRKVMSIARVYGPRSASIFGAVMFMVAIVSSWLPIITGIVGVVYAIMIIIPDAIFVYASIKVLRSPSESNALHVKNVSLFGMLIGLIAFLIGGISS